MLNIFYIPELYLNIVAFEVEMLQAFQSGESGVTNFGNLVEGQV